MIFHQNIGIKRNAFTNEECDFLINFFDEKRSKQGNEFTHNFTKSRQDITICPEIFGSYNKDYKALVENRLDYFYKEYKKRFSIGNKILFLPENYYNKTYKIQRSETGGGFISLHVENSLITRSTLARFLVWMVYLNDEEIKSGGKTDFPYQELLVTPEKGTLVFFPAFFPYLHRSSPDLVGVKYIMTGWFTFKEIQDYIDELNDKPK